MVIPALVTIAASFLTGIVYALGLLISIAALCVSAVFQIKAAGQLKARNPQFFDSLLFGVVINIAGGLVSGVLMIRSVNGIGRFISSTIGTAASFALSSCLCIMYFSKSARVYGYFGGRPLQQSQYWNWISLLPDFIISDAMPDPSQMPQMGRRPDQQNSQSRNNKDD